MYGKNGFAERSKILAGYRKVILLNYQNNCVECSELLDYQNFLQHCSLFLRFQQNYLDDPTNYFQIYIQQNFRSLSKIVLSVYEKKGKLRNFNLNEDDRAVATIVSSFYSHFIMIKRSIIVSYSNGK